MLLTLLIGLAMLVLCLALQGNHVSACMRLYARYMSHHPDRLSYLQIAVLMPTILLMMMLANLAQTAIWAGLFMLLGEFPDFATALYFSGVNFATLGYGDIVMSDRWRLLGPIEAANGIMMFGVSTAVFTAAMIDVHKRFAKPT